MGDEEFVDVRFEGFSNSGLSSRDSFVMEPADSSPLVNQVVEPEKDTKASGSNEAVVNKEDVVKTEDKTSPATTETSDQAQSDQQQQPSWSAWGSALFSAASNSVKALEHGVAKVLDVIEDDGGKEEGSKSSENKAMNVDASSSELSPAAEPNAEMKDGKPMIPIPTGVRDDLRTLSSAVQRTSGKLMSSGIGMLSALGKRTFEVLVAEEEAHGVGSPNTSLSSRLREAKAASLMHEKEQRRQLAYWFDLSGGNDSFEAFRCFSQSSLHSIAGKIDICAAQGGADAEVIPETYKQIAEIFSASSDRLIRAWDSSDFGQTSEEGDLLDGVVLAALLKDRLASLTAPSDRLCSALEKAKKDLLSADLTQDMLYENTLSSLANFTAATINYLHKSVQLLHASALSAHIVKMQPGKGSFIRGECAAVLEIAAAFSTACLILALRIRAISLAGKSAVIKTISQSSVQPDDESSPELAATSLDLEATDCAAHLAKILGFLGPVVQHLLLLRLYGADCRPPASENDDNS